MRKYVWLFVLAALTCVAAMTGCAKEKKDENKIRVRAPFTKVDVDTGGDDVHVDVDVDY